MMYSVRRQTRYIDKSQDGISSEKAFAVMIQNKGTDGATIDNNIPLAAGDSYVFNYLPNCIIKQPFKITFDGTAGLTQKVVFIYSIAEPIR